MMLAKSLGEVTASVVTSPRAASASSSSRPLLAERRQGYGVFVGVDHHHDGDAVRDFVGVPHHFDKKPRGR